MSQQLPVPAYDILGHFLMVLIAVIVSAKLMGALFRRVGQPSVMGEVVAGLALGPSLLGAVSPAAYGYLLPASMAPMLGLTAQIGVIVFMFLVGIELDKKLLSRRGVASVVISHASIVCPFALGCALALWLYRDFAPPGVPFLQFSLFLGTALSITAFPVLARILADLGITRSPMAAVTLTCAAIDDVTAWCLLAALIGVAKSDLRHAAATLGLAVLFAAVLLTAGRTLMRRLVRRAEKEGLTSPITVLLVVLMLACALATEQIGIHALFGAFLLGTLIPRDSRLGEQLVFRFEQFVLTLLLPVYFAFTGMRTQLNLLTSVEHWLWCAAICVVAIVGKVGGATLAARLSGIGWPDALGIGVLMNARGLVALVILNVGLDLGILSPRLFAMMVIMAVVTTLMATPLFALVTRGSPAWRGGAR